MMTNSDAMDVLVFGGGPAGLAAALRLRQHGLNVQIVTKRKHTRERIGDHLSASATKVLSQLGCWTSFQQDGHLPSYGTRSIWGSDRPNDVNSIYNPAGAGWHLDRSRFESMVTRHVDQQGIPVHIGKPLDVTPLDSGWRVCIGSSTYYARYVIDASGKEHAFARRLGVPRLREDRQLAFFAYFKVERPGEYYALVEASESGWWYSAYVPGGYLAAVFMSDSETLTAFKLQQPYMMLKHMLAAAPYTSDRIRSGCRELSSPVAAVSIESGRLSSVCGDNWLAVGDAALCFDPIAAHGLTHALVTGRDAADAVASAISKRAEMLQGYARRLDQTYAFYSSNRLKLYRAENRWPQSVYWNNRKKGSEVSIASLTFIGQ